MSTFASANMSLKLEPVVLEDFDKALRHLYFDGGDLAGSPLPPLCWPLQDQQEASQRLKYYMYQQRQRFLLESTTRFMKVTDA
jgi:hypothetical protein